MTTLTDDEFRSLFADRPKIATTDDGMPTCPYCHAPYSAESLVHFNAATEAGTDYCVIEITCDACGRVMYRGSSWYPGIQTKAELIEVATEILDDEDWEQQP